MATIDQQSATGLPLLAGQVMRERPGRLQLYSSSLWQNKLALIGAVIIVVIVIGAITAPWIAPHDPQSQSLAARFTPPVWQEGGTWTHPLGTDALGRDLLSRLIYGARISLIVGIMAVLIQGIIGVILGVLSGFYGGAVDSVLMRITDVQYAVPFLVLAVAIMAVIGASLRNIIIVLGVTGWVYYARIARAEALALRNREFVEAAHALGASNIRIMIRHILPNLTASIIVIATLRFSSMIIQEASLSFLGLGVPPNIPSWGVMVAEGRGYVDSAWWVAGLSGGAIFLLVMSVNIVGDWLRDELDPTMKGSQ